MGGGGQQQWEGDPQDSLETRRPHVPLLRGRGPGTALVELRVILICLFHGQVEDREETPTKQVPASEVQSTHARHQGHRHTGIGRQAQLCPCPSRAHRPSPQEDGGAAGRGTEAWVLCVPEEPPQPGACREGFGEGSCPSGQDAGAGRPQGPRRPARPTSDLSLTLQADHHLLFWPQPLPRPLSFPLTLAHPHDGTCLRSARRLTRRPHLTAAPSAFGPHPHPPPAADPGLSLPHPPPCSAPRPLRAPWTRGAVLGPLLRPQGSFFSGSCRWVRGLSSPTCLTKFPPC